MSYRSKSLLSTLDVLLSVGSKRQFCINLMHFKCSFTYILYFVRVCRALIVTKRTAQAKMCLYIEGSEVVVAMSREFNSINSATRI